MSDYPIGDLGKPIEQPSNDLSAAMGQLSVTSNENSPSLSDMPIDVVSLIIDRSDYKQQLKLRKVSKSLRALVDKLEPACKKIHVACWMEKVYITFDSDTVIYSKSEYDAGFNAETRINIVRDDFKKVAFDDLASTLKNPKLQLDEFCVCQNCENRFEKHSNNNIRTVLESLNHQVSVKEFKLDRLSPTSSLSVLPYLKPGFLEKISLANVYDDWRNESITMDKVARLEQWKQAKELEMYNFFEDFPLKYATYFKRFYTCERRIGEDKFIRIMDCLSKLQNFEHCTLSYIEILFRPGFIFQVLGEPVSCNATGKACHYPIPDSDYYLEFKKAPRSIDFEITKKKREGN